MEQVVHLSGVKLGAAAEPIAALRLIGGYEIVLRGVTDLILAALGIGEAKPGHLEAGVDEVAGLAGVCEDGFVDRDRGGAVAGVLGQVGLLEAEEVVARVFGGEAMLDDESFGVAGVVAEEEREGGAGLDGGDGAVGGGLAEELEALLAVAADAGDSDHDAKEAGQAGDGELLDSDGHLGVGVVGVDLEGLLAVVAGGESLAGGGDVAVVDEGDEGGVHAAGVSAGEPGVFIGGVGLDALIAEGGDGVGEGFDAVASRLRDEDAAFGGEEGVVRVVGGVEEILVVELAKDGDHENVIGGHGILRVGGQDGLEAGEGSFIVEDVELLVALMDGRVQIEGGGVERVGRGLRPRLGLQGLRRADRSYREKTGDDKG